MTEQDELRNLKLAAKKHLEEIAKSINQNGDQVYLIKKLIDKCDSEKEINDVIRLMSPQIKLGLVFDEAPIVKSKNVISVLTYDKTLSFENQRERERERVIPLLNIN